MFRPHTVKVARVITMTALGNMLKETALWINMGVIARIPISGDV
jgi:hypothetical protein